MSKRELLYQPGRELRVQTSPDGSRSITGYAIRYNEPSSDLGGFVEIVAPGAVTDSLKNSPDVLCLRDHDSSILLGRTKARTLTLSEDASGLRFACNLPATTQASDLATSINRRDLDGMSFGFQTVEEKWTKDGSGNLIRTLLKINLFEISPCSFPAYASTSVSIRSCPPALRPLLTRSHSDGCDCDCAECADGSCDECTDDECVDESCAENGCPNQEDEDRSNHLSWSERTLLRIDVARRK